MKDKALMLERELEDTRNDVMAQLKDAIEKGDLNKVFGNMVDMAEPEDAEEKEINLSARFNIPFTIERTVRASSVDKAIRDFFNDTVKETIRETVEEIKQFSYEFTPECWDFELITGSATLHFKEDQNYQYTPSGIPGYASFTSQQREECRSQKPSCWGDIIEEFEEGEWIKE